MVSEEKSVVQVSASPKALPTSSTLNTSDTEPQSVPSHEKGTFEATEGHEFYKPIDSYEGIHRWDPTFQRTEQEEKQIVKKVS